MRKTKIICTIGPASESSEVLTKLVKAGMNIARFNFSHGDHDEQLNKVKVMREINSKLNTNVALLLDTKGPEIRTHNFENGSVEIKTNDIVRISMKEVLGTKELFSITYSELIHDIEVGNSILVDDGAVELVVVKKEEDTLVCMALNDGVFKNKRGINVPNVKLNFDFISVKDRSDIEFACDNDLDFIAASFVRRPSDVLEIREILKEKGNETIQIISKIESDEAVNNIEEIIKVSDGIMIARGDLGVEVPLEEVPLIQKNIIKLCNKMHKPVIVATQMLESMQKSPRPTRAEVNDVANAVIDGADAIMLSGETANGLYPVKSVETMAKIATYSEMNIDYSEYAKRAYKDSKKVYRDVIASSSVYAANDLDAKAIIASTKTGRSADMISIFRPKCPIVAATVSNKVARSLALRFGVYPIITKEVKTMEELIENVIDEVKTLLDLNTGDDVIITGGFKKNEEGSTDFMKFKKIS